MPAFDNIEKQASKSKATTKRPKKISLAKLLILGQNREINIRKVLEYETTDIPLALFDEKGKMRKTNKALLTKELEIYLTGDSPSLCVPAEKALIIDGMSIIQVIKGSGTFGGYAKLLLKKVLSEGFGYKRVDVVFHVYDPQSFKSAERACRGDQKMCNICISCDDTHIPSNWLAFLSNINNKNSLVS